MWSVRRERANPATLLQTVVCLFLTCLSCPASSHFIVLFSMFSTAHSTSSVQIFLQLFFSLVLLHIFSLLFVSHSYGLCGRTISSGIAVVTGITFNLVRHVAFTILSKVASHHFPKATYFCATYFSLIYYTRL